MTTEDKIIINTDGGARGNPGPAALGVVISISGNGELWEKKEKYYGEYLGTKTNNEAEYLAVIFALKKLKQLIGKKKSGEVVVELRSDSELVVRQLSGQYRIDEDKLKPLFIDVWNLKQDFKEVRFVHVRREENRLADKMVNQAIDEAEGN